LKFFKTKTSMLLFDLLLLLRLLLHQLPLASSLHFTTSPRDDLNLIFTPKAGWTWLGGDSSSSVQMNDGDNHLWIFGDTLRGKLVRNNTQRDIEDMPHSTFALLASNLTRSPTFFFPPTDRGWFSPPASTAPSSSYYWLIDGIVGRDTGHLFLQAMVINGSPSGFVQLGTDLIVIDVKSSSNPNSWTSTSYRLPNTNGTFTMNEGVGQFDGYLYFLGNCNGTAACLSRYVSLSFFRSLFCCCFGCVVFRV
jgi:hypothetical protein